VDSLKSTLHEHTELSHSVERLINIVYLLTLEDGNSPRVRHWLQIADKDLQQIKALMKASDIDGEDVIS